MAIFLVISLVIIIIFIGAFILYYFTFKKNKDEDNKTKNEDDDLLENTNSDIITTEPTKTLAPIIASTYNNTAPQITISPRNHSSSNNLSDRDKLLLNGAGLVLNLGIGLAAQYIDDLRRADSPEKKARLRANAKADVEKAKVKVEKTKLDADKAKIDADKAKAKANAAKADAEKAKANADRAKADAEKAKTNANNAKANAEKAKLDADKAKVEADKAKADADKAKRKADMSNATEEDKAKARKAKADADNARSKADKAKSNALKASQDADDAKTKSNKAKIEANRTRTIEKASAEKAKFTDIDQANSDVDRANADLKNADAELEKAKADAKSATFEADKAASDVDDAKKKSNKANADYEKAKNKASSLSATESDKIKLKKAEIIKAQEADKLKKAQLAQAEADELKRQKQAELDESDRKANESKNKAKVTRENAKIKANKLTSSQKLKRTSITSIKSYFAKNFPTSVKYAKMAFGPLFNTFVNLMLAIAAGVELSTRLLFNFGSRLATTVIATISNLVNLRLIAASKSLGTGLFVTTIGLLKEVGGILSFTVGTLWSAAVAAKAGLAASAAAAYAKLVNTAAAALASAKASLVAARAAGAAATALNATKAAVSFVGGSISAALLVFTIINMIVDSYDPAGYNMLEKMNMINNQIHEQITSMIENVNEENKKNSIPEVDVDGNAIEATYTPFIYPSIVGPVDMLSLKEATPELVISDCINLLPTYTTNYIGEISNGYNIVGNIIGNYNILLDREIDGDVLSNKITFSIAAKNNIDIGIDGNVLGNNIILPENYNINYTLRLDGKINNYKTVISDSKIISLGNEGLYEPEFVGDIYIGDTRINTITQNLSGNNQIVISDLQIDGNIKDKVTGVLMFSDGDIIGNITGTIVVNNFATINGKLIKNSDDDFYKLQGNILIPPSSEPAIDTSKLPDNTSIILSDVTVDKILGNYITGVLKYPDTIVNGNVTKYGDIIGDVTGNIISYDPIKMIPKYDVIEVGVDGNEIYGNEIKGYEPKVFDCRMNKETNKIMEDENSKLSIIQIYNENIKRFQNNLMSIALGEVEGDLEVEKKKLIDYVKGFYKNDFKEVTNIATEKICNENGGFFTKNSIGKPVCSYNKELCVNRYKPLEPQVCKEGPPAQCSRTPSVNCTGGIPELESDDVDKMWSDTNKVCLTVNGIIKDMCITNNLNYNLLTDMCEMTVSACLSKAGTPITKSDGTIDCTIPISQIITEALLGKTLTNSLIQTFDPRQYKCPRDNLIDLSDPDPFIDKLCTTDGIKELLMENMILVGLMILPIGIVISIYIAGFCATVYPVRSYNCREPCREGADYIAAMCVGGKKNGPKCDPGWREEGELCVVGGQTANLIPGEFPTICPDGYSTLGVTCIKNECDNPTDTETVPGFCRKACIDGFREKAGVCWSDKQPPTTIPKREPCDEGYNYDNITTCWMDDVKPRGGGIAPTECGENANLVGITCWDRCSEGEKDKGATCESCPSYMVNNGASLCYERCDKGYNYDGGILCHSEPKFNGFGTIPNKCPDLLPGDDTGWLFQGSVCVKQPTNNVEMQKKYGIDKLVNPLYPGVWAADSDYELRPGDIINYWLKIGNISYYTDAGIPPEFESPVCTNYVQPPDVPDAPPYCVLGGGCKEYQETGMCNGCPGGTRLPGLCKVCDAGGVYVPSIPAIPFRQSIPSVPGIGFEAAIPALPAIPFTAAIPAVPEIPFQPYVAAVPEIPFQPYVAAVPEIPFQPYVAAVPEIPFKPYVAAVPEIPFKAAIPSVPAVEFKPKVCFPQTCVDTPIGWNSCKTRSEKKCSGNDCMGGTYWDSGCDCKTWECGGCDWGGCWSKKCSGCWGCARWSDCNSRSAWVCLGGDCIGGFDTRTDCSPAYCNPEVPAKAAIPASPEVAYKAAIPASPEVAYKAATPASPEVAYRAAIPASPEVAYRAAIPASPEVAYRAAIPAVPAVKQQMAIPGIPQINARPAIPAVPEIKGVPEIPGYWIPGMSCEKCGQDNEIVFDGIDNSPDCSRCGKNKICKECNSVTPPKVCTSAKCREGTKTVGDTYPLMTCTTCKSNRSLDKSGLLCYQNCSPGYLSVLGVCWNKKPLFLPIPVSATSKASCGTAEEVSGLCYASCQENKRVPGVPTQCMGPKGLSYVTKTKIPDTKGKNSREAGCKSNREKTDSLCYEKCSDKYGPCYSGMPGAPTFCQPSKGMTYRPPISENPCPEGYVYDASMSACKNSYIPRSYLKKLVNGKCPDGHDNILNTCWENCPEIDVEVDGNNTKIQLGHVDLFPFKCGPRHDGKYPPFYLANSLPFYYPKIVPKIRSVSYSSKDDKGKVVT
jgi:hypothetical protein